MSDPRDLDARLARLAPDQRAAATAPPGPILCVAPAGSGKTTTLVARIAWLAGTGVDPASITALTFNRRAAEELGARLTDALPLGTEVRVRTFHALGLEILRDAGLPVAPLLDRDEVLRRVRLHASAAERRRIDLDISRLKLDLGVTADQVAADPGAGPLARTFVDYERALAAAGGLDFDDLVVRALRALETDAALERWRARCAHLCVDEAQDLDRSQLRLALLLAAPANRIFLVGDDDQSIYGWRLADVRRLLGLAATSLPGLRRVDLEVNYRCPAVVVERAVRLVAHNEERFAKRIRTPPGAAGRLILGPTAADDLARCLAVLRSWAAETGTLAILARTNRELVPAAVAAIDLGIPFQTPDLGLPVEAPDLDEALAALEAEDARLPLLVRAGRVRARLRSPTAAALVGWSAGFRTATELREVVETARSRLVELRRHDARLTLATAHATKGLEFEHVAVLGLDAGRFPSARAVAEATEPERALEEERRLAYVAWTRARRSLTLVYDPGAPSPFLLEAFDPAELDPHTASDVYVEAA